MTLWQFLFEPRRKALVFKRADSQKIVDVRRTQGGYIAKTGSYGDEWSVLLADGTVRGFGEGVFTWEPVSGWTPDELAQLSLTHRMIES